MNHPRLRLTLLFAALVLFAVVADAQQTPAPPASSSEAQKMLESSDPRLQAWGAWYAGRMLFKECAPQLERLVDNQLKMSGWPQAAVLDIALDALIELEAKPDPELLLRVHHQRPVQALIMLARLGERAEPVLLELMSQTEGYSWFAAANLLYQRKARGFAVLLLRDIELKARVFITEDGNYGMNGGSGCGGAGDGGTGMAPGYPPWPGYAPRSHAAPGMLILAKGPTTVYYERIIAPAGQSPSGSGSILCGPKTEDRLAFFERVTPQIRANETLSVAWQGGRALKAETDHFVAEIGRKYKQFIAALVNDAWLTADEAVSLTEPRIRVETIDLRKN